MAKPFEAKSLPELEVNNEMRVEFNNLLTAVQGTSHWSGFSENIGYALRWLRDNPDAADVLLSRSNVHARQVDAMREFALELHKNPVGRFFADEIEARLKRVVEGE